mgnify:CR=1 FL=1
MAHAGGAAAGGASADQDVDALPLLAAAAFKQFELPVQSMAASSSEAVKTSTSRAFAGCHHSFAKVVLWRPRLQLWYDVANQKDMTQEKPDSISIDGKLLDSIVGPEEEHTFHKQLYKCLGCSTRFVVCKQCIPHRGMHMIPAFEDSHNDPRLMKRLLQQHTQGRFHMTCQLNDYQDFLQTNGHKLLCWRQIQEIVSDFRPDEVEKHDLFNLEQCNKVLQVWRQILASPAEVQKKRKKAKS